MRIYTLLLLSLFAFAACKKEAKILPKTTPATTTVVTAVKPDTTPVAAAAKPDTIPDKAALKIQVVKDGSNYDEAMFVFNHTSKLTYDANIDAAYFAGFGEVSLASISADGQGLAVYNLPYKSGMAIGLDVEAKADGPLYFKISYEKKIPENIQIWVKDTYLKDSVNVCNGNYNFNVTKADTNSFGTKRFKLIIKDNGLPPASH
jgi:hypothetical protein